MLGVWLAIIAFVAAQAEDLLDTALEGLMMSPGARGSRPSAVLVRLSRDMQLSDERLRRTLRCSILLEGRGVLLAGDALATFDPTTRTRGPRLLSITPTTSRPWRRSRNWKTRARPRCCRVTAPPGAATSPRPFAGLVMAANPAASPRERSSPDDLIQPGLPAVRGKRPSAADRREAKPGPQGRRQATVHGPNGAVIRDHYKFRGPHGSPRPSASRRSPRRAGQAQGGWKRQLACVRSQRRFR